MKDTDDEKISLDDGMIVKAIERTGGYFFWFILILSFAGTEGFGRVRDYYMKNLSSETKDSSDQPGFWFFLVCALIQISLEMIRWYSLCMIGARMSKSLHENLLTKVM